MSTYRLTPAAQRDLSSIWDYTQERWDLAQAEVYVTEIRAAIERIAGTLDGRRGSFLTQHNGILDRGQATLALTVVPDSGTGELAGLRGRMAIDIVDGAHCYAFDYALDDAGGRE